MNKRRHFRQHTLLALLLGVSFAGGALALMPLLDSETQILLMQPKIAFSNLVGDLFNWSEHTRRHDPIGLWLETALLALGISTVSWFFLRTKWFANLCRDGDCVIMQLIAVSSPWVIVIFGIIPNRTRTSLFLAAFTLLLAVTLWLLMAVFARGASHRLAGTISVLVFNSVQCGIIINYLLGDMYLRPLAYVSLLLGIALLSLRILKIESV